MNQILFVDDKKRKSSINIKSIIMFFATTIIVFGLIMVVDGSYGVYAYNKDQEKNNGKSNVPAEQANIQMSQTSDDTINVSINSNIGISEVIYNWNSDAAETSSENGKTSIFKSIEMPVGENTLNVRVIDIDGNETKKSETFTKAEKEKPLIELTSSGDKVKISVTSKTELTQVTYKWNSDNVNTSDMATYQDKTKFEQEITIPTGQNTLVVTATDKNGKTSEKSQIVDGILITITPTIEGKYMVFEVVSSEIIKKVEFTFNGVSYLIDSNIIKNEKKVKYGKEMIEGLNTLQVKATVNDKATKTGQWKYEYKP